MAANHPDRLHEKTGLACPACGATVTIANVNIPEGVGCCTQCGTVSGLRELVQESKIVSASPEIPPAGCRLVTDGVRAEISASTRSLGTAAGLLFFGTFWNGVVSIFVYFAAASTLVHIWGELPGWFPLHSQLGQAGDAMPLWITIFLWIFLLPFIAIGSLVVWALPQALFGRVRVRLEGHSGEVFTGVGPMGRRRRFDPVEVRSVGVVRRSRTGQDATPAPGQIAIEADRTIKFGSALPDARKAWVVAVLRAILVVR